MAPPTKAPRRFSAATLALAVAGLLAIAAIGIAIFRSGDRTDAPAAPTNAVAAATEAPSVDQMISRLQEEIRRNPDNHEAWYLMGLAFRDNLRFPEAEQAFRRAMELAPQNADYTGYLAEVLLLRNQVDPPPEAERLFRRALELQPGNPQARFYLATLRDRRGDHRGAVDELIALLRDAPANAPWTQQVRESTVSIARLNNINIEGRLPAPSQAAAATGTATAAIPGPTRQQMEAASAIPPSQQDQMVRGMVDRLAARLRQNPRDAQGWIQLMRSRMVLNDPAAATQALNSGLAAFANDSAVQGQMRTAARQLGVPNG